MITPYLVVIPEQVEDTGLERGSSSEVGIGSSSIARPIQTSQENVVSVLKRRYVNKKTARDEHGNTHKEDCSSQPG